MLLIASVTKIQAQEEMQEKLREIPEAPEAYSAATVAARMVEGLGFRFYWATEGLRPEDLAYKPSEEARTTEETINHIYGLSRTRISHRQWGSSCQGRKPS